MRDVLIALVCLYFAYKNIEQLVLIPVENWIWVNWLTIPLIIALAGTGLFKLWQAARAMFVAQRRAKDIADEIQSGSDGDGDAGE